MVEIGVSGDTLDLLREYSEAGGNISISNAVLQPNGTFLVRVPGKFFRDALRFSSVDVDEIVADYLGSLLG
jgi:hypothetical protein